jgi:tetratricopeptide (TPR) repeat protein
MALRDPRLPLAPLAFALLALCGPGSAGVARADEDPPKDAPAGDAPAAGAPAAAPKHDDVSIFKDWGLVKRGGGIQRSKDRAAFWEQKGVSGKDHFWIARMWERGEVYDKAAASYEQYLAWTPPAGDERLAKEHATNGEVARQLLPSVYFWSKKYPEAVKAAETFRELHADNRDVGFSWVWQGRAHRLLGDEANAIAAFGKASEAKILKGLLDLVDLHLVAGRVEEARSAVGAFAADPKHVATLEIVKPFFDLVGTDAPSLEGAVNVGRSDAAPTSWKGRAIAVYHWHMQLNYGERKLQLFDAAARDAGDGATTLALSTYNQLNPTTQKVEPDMSEATEIDWYRKQILDWKPNIPYTLVVKKPVLEGLGLKGEGQMVIVDAQGKIRWMRLSDIENYDRVALGLALKHIAAAK